MSDDCYSGGACCANGTCFETDSLLCEKAHGSFYPNVRCNELEDGLKFIYMNREFKLHKIIYGANLDKVSCSICEDDYWGRQMNIEKVTNKYISLYGYDMMTQRTTYKMSIADMWIQEIE